MLECSVGQEVFMDIAYEILNYLIHVVVHHCYPLTPRSTESLQHKLDLALYQLIRTQRIPNYLLEILVCFSLTLQKILNLNKGILTYWWLSYFKRSLSSVTCYNFSLSWSINLEFSSFFCYRIVTYYFLRCREFFADSLFLLSCYYLDIGAF